MIYVHIDQNIAMTWRVFRGLSANEEDFTRVNLLKVFLFDRATGTRFHIHSDVRDNRIILYIPAGMLPPGVYGMDALWIKNAHSFLERHDLDLRCIIRSRKDKAFAVTEYQKEATVFGEDTVKLVCKTTVATYGYDGLSAYEIAVLRGLWNGSEEDWITEILTIAGKRNGWKAFVNVPFYLNDYTPKTLEEAIRSIDPADRIRGQVITFIDENGEWRIIQFLWGDLSDYENPENWGEIGSGKERLRSITVIPDHLDFNNMESQNVEIITEPRNLAWSIAIYGDEYVDPNSGLNITPTSITWDATEISAKRMEVISTGEWEAHVSS